MDGPNNIQPGRKAIPLTFSVMVLKQTLDQLTRILGTIKNPGILFLKINASNMEFLPATRKKEANVLLNIFGFSNVADSLPPESRAILAFRGHSSVFLVSSIEKPNPLDPGLEKYLRDIVLESNRGVINTILSELQTPWLVSRTVENAQWCENVQRWAAIYDLQGKVVKITENSNIMIMGMDGKSLDLLSRLYKEVTEGFQKDKPFLVPSQAQIELAPTAFHSIREPFGQAIALDNILAIQEEIEKPGANVNLYLKADISDGSIAVVKEEERYNMVLNSYRQNIVVRPGFAVSIELVRAIYLDAVLLDPIFLHPKLRERVNVQAYFTEMVQELNNALCRTQIESVKQISQPQEYSFLLDRIEALKSQGFSVFRLFRQA